MKRLLFLHIIFFIVAIVIAFVLIPLDQMYFRKVPVEEIKTYYQNAFTFTDDEAWKKVFTWFLGLSCGRLMLKALMSKG